METLETEIHCVDHWWCEIFSIIRSTWSWFYQWNCWNCSEIRFALLSTSKILWHFHIDAWLLTNGYNTGIVQLVGHAIQKIRYTKQDTKITAIGVCKWGCVSDVEYITGVKKANHDREVFRIWMFPYFFGLNFFV